jgi:hypothetical protein
MTVSLMNVVSMAGVNVDPTAGVAEIGKVVGITVGMAVAPW